MTSGAVDDRINSQANRRETPWADLHDIAAVSQGVRCQTGPMAPYA